MTLEKSFEEISEADLLLLVEDKVSEKRTIEYKRELPSDTQESKKEFLADISSLGNASGGHIIFGIQEENGLPIAISGVPCDDPDHEVLRIENLIRDGLEPRLQGVSVRGISLSSGTYAFILRVPRSWSKPHVVNYKGHWRFYSRNSAGKYPLDTSEVRSAFLQSGALAEKIRLFRDERLGSVISEQMPA
jgi:predicted HTH transcriptional regulator